MRGLTGRTDEAGGRSIVFSLPEAESRPVEAPGFGLAELPIGKVVTRSRISPPVFSPSFSQGVLA